ncbi:unnamed protein product [Medioppia subpectinata]|uniref:L-dopachrome isomerase n=1 Tax=Medioppia subpectinata TaxID=1979941 RepID=A0A7R9KWM2_9ACAR|nr:unnamed protein product [Medioppia subpectinata]CAG2110874.1 unnamed protein product [Medioppia subpectinata]
MPFLHLYTTLPAHRVPQDFSQKTAVLLSQLLGKPAEIINIHVITEQNIYQGTDPERQLPNGYAVIRSVGTGSPDDIKRTIAELTAHVKQTLGIDEKQFIVFIIDADPNLIGKHGKVLAGLLKHGTW